MDTITKMTFFGGLICAGFVVFNLVMNKDTKPQNKKQTQSITLGDMDKQIDERNQAFGKPVPADPDIPSNSRYNHNRKRRGNHM
jgi:hypothetical protein